MPQKRQSVKGVWNEEGLPADPAYAQRLADLKVAAQDVGATPASRLKWLVEFAQQDPATWQSSTRAAHGNSILALTGFYMPAFLHGGVTLPAPIPAEDIDEVHRELSQMLRAIVNGRAGETVFLPNEVVRTGIMRATERSKKPAIWASVHQYASPLGVLHVLKDLILTAGERLVACKRCGTPFIAIKKQEFCTLDCSQAERNIRKKLKPKGPVVRRKQR